MAATCSTERTREATCHLAGTLAGMREIEEQFPVVSVTSLPRPPAHTVSLRRGTFREVLDFKVQFRLTCSDAPSMQPSPCRVHDWVPKNNTIHTNANVLRAGQDPECRFKTIALHGVLT